MKVTTAFGVMKLAKCLNSIKHFNDIGGQFDIPHRFQLSVDLLMEEVKEYQTAKENNDQKEVEDALGDIFYVLWGVILKDGLEEKFLHILSEICDSNMSKFDEDEEQARITKEKYSVEKGISTTIEYNSKYDVYVNKREDGKILKSHKFKKPQL